MIYTCDRWEEYQHSPPEVGSLEPFCQEGETGDGPANRYPNYFGLACFFNHALLEGYCLARLANVMTKLFIARRLPFCEVKPPALRSSRVEIREYPKLLIFFHSDLPPIGHSRY